MLKVARNSWYADAVKKNYYTSQHPWLSISDLATRQMHAYYVAAHHTIKTKKTNKHTNYGNLYLKIM